MGCPGTGRPGAGRIGAPACAAGAGGLTGALYTGRGPVCGTMKRGGGGPWRGVATGGLPAGKAVAWGAGGGATGGAGVVPVAAGAEGIDTTTVDAAVAKGWIAGTDGAGTTGLIAGGGTTTLGCAAGAGALGDGATGAATGGLASTGGWAGRAGDTAGGACCLRMALRTSPGREIWERSILVLISSESARVARAGFAAAWFSPAERRKWLRTFSASWSSRELECVFFSVTPTSSSTSRMALLLTSNSLARSLIRVLLIRPFLPPDSPAKSSYQPHGASFPLPGFYDPQPA